MGRRVSYSAFRTTFIVAWLLVAGAVVCAAAHIRVGFVLLACAGVLLACLGTMLALNSGKLSDRMVEEVVSRWGNAERPLSVSRVGGTMLLVVGCGMAILSVVALSR